MAYYWRLIIGRIFVSEFFFFFLGGGGGGGLFSRGFIFEGAYYLNFTMVFIYLMEVTGNS